MSETPDYRDWIQALSAGPDPSTWVSAFLALRGYPEAYWDEAWALARQERYDPTHLHHSLFLQLDAVYPGYVAPPPVPFDPDKEREKMRILRTRIEEMKNGLRCL